MDQTAQAEGPRNEAYDPRMAGSGLVGAKLATPTKPGQLVMQLEEQSMLTGQLNERLEILFEKVRPVWQAPNQKDGATEADRAELPQYLEQVASNNRRIRQAISMVILMTEGLEL